MQRGQRDHRNDDQNVRDEDRDQHDDPHHEKGQCDDHLRRPALQADQVRLTDAHARPRIGGRDHGDDRAPHHQPHDRSEQDDREAEAGGAIGLRQLPGRALGGDRVAHRAEHLAEVRKGACHVRVDQRRKHRRRHERQRDHDDDRYELPDEHRYRTVQQLAGTQRTELRILHVAEAFARARRESRGMDLGTVASLWRYPVKSLKGEPLQRATVLADGFEGDRCAALIVETAAHARAGKPYRGKESSRLHLTADPQIAASYAADAMVQVKIDRREPRYFDARAVSLLFDLWVHDVEALVGEPLDPRRWRPNIFVASAPGFARRERELLGTDLRVGGVALRVVDTIRRCVTTTYDVATGESLPRRPRRGGAPARQRRRRLLRGARARRARARRPADERLAR